MLLTFVALAFASIAMMVLSVGLRVHRLRWRATVTDLAAWQGRLLREYLPSIGASENKAEALCCHVWWA